MDFGRSPACFRAWELPGAVGAIQIDGNEAVRALGTPGGRPGHPWGDIDTKILQNQENRKQKNYKKSQKLQKITKCQMTRNHKI